MRCNVAGWDRWLRLLIGTSITAWALAGGPWWAYLGVLIAATGAWRFCPLYGLLRTHTRGRG